jgi:hypothetical protein
MPIHRGERRPPRTALKMRSLINILKRNIVAYVALLVALSGTAVAAVTVPRSSVGAAQLKNGAVTNAKVRRHSLSASVFAPGVLPTGAPASGAPLDTTIVYGPANPPSCAATGCPTDPAGTSNTETAPCPSGDRVLGGGFTIGPSSPTDETVSSSTPTTSGTGWQVTFVLTQSGAYPVGIVSAVCAPGQ